MVSLHRWGRVVLALWVCIGSGAALAERPAPREVVERPGVVTKVSDGDTFWWRPEQCEEGSRCRPVKVRMLGIDAPERCQQGGEQSTDVLRARLLNQTVRVRTSARDTYGRVLGEVRLDNIDVGAWMVRQGHAWSYRNGRSKGPYIQEEQVARAARAGLFAQADAMDPSLFRKVHGPCERS
ncbi:MAG: thermonuclease family protein [Pseudomonadota bacterium]